MTWLCCHFERKSPALLLPLHSPVYQLVLTPTKKAKIVRWKRKGWSHDYIRAHLTGHHELSDHQITRIWKRYSEKENYYDVGHKFGRPPKMDKQTKPAL
jgi:aromatic ring-cleaving dioxygenase